MLGGGRLDYVCDITGGANPCARGGGGLYRVRQVTAILHYKGLNIHKVGALQVTPALSVVNDLKDYGGNA